MFIASNANNFRVFQGTSTTTIWGNSIAPLCFVEVDGDYSNDDDVHDDDIYRGCCICSSVH